MPTVEYKTLQVRNPRYRAAYWPLLRALTDGGEKLLTDGKVLERLLPKHAFEHQDVYEERKSRVVYMNYAGEIVSQLTSMLAEDPLITTAEPKLDEFYTAYVDNVDGKHMTATAFLQHLCSTAFQTQFTWVLCDMPPMPDGGVADRGTEERDIGDKIRLTQVQPEDVVDWQEDEDGNLIWACIFQKTQRRDDPFAGDRNTIRERYMFWYADRCEEFVIDYPVDRPPTPLQTFTSKTVTHTFGVVPMLRFELPCGMWALDKLFTLARAHLNLRSGLTWAEIKNLFPTLAAFLGSEVDAAGSLPSEAQQKPDRAKNQVYGTGYVNEFGSGDDLRYVSAPSDVFTVAMTDCDGIRDEMHRIVGAMSLTVDNSAGNAGRSGDSKSMDKVGEHVVMKKIGELLIDFWTKCLKLVERCRGEITGDPGQETGGRKWSPTGFQAFDAMGSSAAIADAIQVDLLNIQSPTFQAVYKGRLAERLVRHEATPEQMVIIRKEIEDSAATAIAQKQAMQDASVQSAQAAADNMSAGNPTAPVPGAAKGAKPGAPAKPSKAAAIGKSAKPGAKIPPKPSKGFGR